MNNLSKIKEKIARKEMVIGSHVELGYPAIPEILGEIGFDALWIDTEHTAIDKQDLYLTLIVASGSKMAPFVRIPWNDPILVKPILEMGPAGIIFPFIRNAEEAKLAVASCTYPPEGIRGFGPIRATRYGSINSLDYIANANESIWKVIQIEHINAVNDIDNILKVKGVDAIVFGPMDLSASVGLLGRPEHPDVQKLIDIVCDKCKKAGMPVGVSTGYSPDRNQGLKKWLDRNLDFVFFGSDISFLINGARAMKENIIKLMNDK